MTTRRTVLAGVVGAAVLATLFATVYAWFAPLPAHAQDRRMERVTVVVRGLRSDTGVVVGAAFATRDAWLQHDRAISECHAPIHDGVARCELEVPAGHAVGFTAMHDEDRDGAFDRDFIGIPQEGYAFANDARGNMGPPSFEAASLVPGAAASFVVHARYGI